MIGESGDVNRYEMDLNFLDSQSNKTIRDLRVFNEENKVVRLHYKSQQQKISDLLAVFRILSDKKEIKELQLQLVNKQTNQPLGSSVKIKSIVKNGLQKVIYIIRAKNKQVMSNKMQDICEENVYSTSRVSLKLLSIKIKAIIEMNLRAQTLEVSSQQSILQLKKLAMAALNLPDKDAVLTYNGEKLEEYNQISDYNITQGSTVVVSIKKLTQGQLIENQLMIKVELDGKKYSLNLSPSFLVQDCLEIIKKSVDKKIENPSLFYAGLKLQKNKALSDYKISHGSCLNMLVQPSKFIRINFPQKDYVIQVESDFSQMTVEELKKKISFKYKVKAQQLLLLFNGRALKNNESIQLDYNYFKEGRLQLFKYGYEKRQRIIKLKIGENSEAFISFSLFSSYTINQITSMFISNPRPYSVLFGSQVFLPSQKLEQVLNSKHYKGQRQITLIIFKLYWKYLMYQTLTKLSIQDYEHDLMTHAKEFGYQGYQSRKLPLFFYYHNYFQQNLFLYFQDIINGNLKSLQFGFVYCLLNSLVDTQNFINEDYQLVKVLKNFRFSLYHQRGDVFIWDSFVSTILVQNQQNRNQFSRQYRHSTLFYINSLTGKSLAQIKHLNKKYSEEIVFLPFSYFHVINVKAGQSYDQVWLEQVPSPTFIKKNLVVWVDDKPHNNTEIIKRMRIKHKDLEIIQLTSTRMAEIWMRQFSWLLNYKRISVKLISDMTRYEDGKWNSSAGVDLLQMMYNKYGYSNKVLIFCSNLNEAHRISKQRNLVNKREKAYSITNKQEEVESYFILSSDQYKHNH